MTPLLEEQLSMPKQAKVIRSFPVPVGGFGDAGQLADWVLFMLSDAAEFLCGYSSTAGRTHTSVLTTGRVLCLCTGCCLTSSDSETSPRRRQLPPRTDGPAACTGSGCGAEMFTRQGPVLRQVGSAFNPLSQVSPGRRLGL